MLTGKGTILMAIFMFPIPFFFAVPSVLCAPLKVRTNFPPRGKSGKRARETGEITKCMRNLRFTIAMASDTQIQILTPL